MVKLIISAILILLTTSCAIQGYQVRQATKECDSQGAIVHHVRGASFTCSNGYYQKLEKAIR